MELSKDIKSLGYIPINNEEQFGSLQFNFDSTRDKNQDEEPNFFYFPKGKETIKDITSSEKINIETKNYLMDKSSKATKEIFLIGNLIKIIIFSLIYIRLFFSSINMNIYILPKSSFFHKIKEILLLYIIIIIDKLVKLLIINYIHEKGRKSEKKKYFKINLGIRSEKLHSFYINNFNIIKNGSINNRIIKDNKNIKRENDRIIKYIRRERRNNSNKKNNIINIIKIKI